MELRISISGAVRKSARLRLKAPRQRHKSDPPGWLLISPGVVVSEAAEIRR
jgi:hypothetical protein